MIKNNIDCNYGIYCEPNQDETNDSASPLETKRGLLFYKQNSKNPQILNNSSSIVLFGEKVVVDHYVLSFPDEGSLKDYAEIILTLPALKKRGFFIQ